MKRASLISSASALVGLDAATAPPSEPEKPAAEAAPPATPRKRAPKPATAQPEEPPAPKRRGRPPLDPDANTTRKPRALYLSDGDMALLRRVAIVRSWRDGERHGPSSVIASLVDEARPRLLAEIKRRPDALDDGE